MAARNFRLASQLLLVIFLTGAWPIHAQEQPQPPAEDKPKPAGTSYPVPLVNLGQQDQDTGPNNGLVPDTTPLTGVQTPTLGTSEVLHSYWIPGFQWSGSIQSTPYNKNQNSSWLMNNFFSGNLSLLKAWNGSQLNVNYSAGGFVSTDSAQGNGYYQQLALSQSFQWKRVQLQILDQFSYLPEASFGFGVGTGLGVPGTGGSLGPTIPGTGNNYVPNQSIYAAVGPRYSNSSSLQLTYTTSPRGSITVSGSYGLLNFVNSGNVNNNSITGTIGYNYVLTRADTIGIFYRFSAYHFSGEPQAFGDHSVNFAYGRKLTGRLALQLYGGPDFTTSRISTNGKSTYYGVSAGANLSYALQNGGLTGSFTHSISGGSGVLTGSSGDLLSFGATHKLTRIWSGQFNVGFAHNTSIVTAPKSFNTSYNSWTAGGGVNRPFGRNATFAIAYNANIADTSSSGCVGTACSSSQTYHYITLNFQWRTRPLVLP